MTDPTRIPRIMEALQIVWSSNPHLTFGQMIEKVEDIAWLKLEQDTQRGYSARWLHLPDAYLEAALEQARRGL